MNIALTQEQQKEHLAQKQKQFMGSIRALEKELGLKAEPVLQYTKNGIIALISVREMTEEEKK